MRAHTCECCTTCYKYCTQSEGHLEVGFQGAKRHVTTTNLRIHNLLIYDMVITVLRSSQVNDNLGEISHENEHYNLTLRIHHITSILDMRKPSQRRFNWLVTGDTGKSQVHGRTDDVGRDCFKLYWIPSKIRLIVVLVRMLKYPMENEMYKKFQNSKLWIVDKTSQTQEWDVEVAKRIFMQYTM